MKISRHSDESRHSDRNLYHDIRPHSALKCAATTGTSSAIAVVALICQRTITENLPLCALARVVYISEELRDFKPSCANSYPSNWRSSSLSFRPRRGLSAVVVCPRLSHLARPKTRRRKIFPGDPVLSTENTTELTLPNQKLGIASLAVSFFPEQRPVGRFRSGLTSQLVYRTTPLTPVDS
eukprot:IDg10225t1